MEAFTPIILLFVLLAFAVVIYLLLKKGGSGNQEDLRTDIALLEASNNELNKNIQAKQIELEELRSKYEILTKENSALEERNKNLNEKIDTQKEDFNKLQEHFQKEFENLATKILNDSSDRLSSLNKDKIKVLLDPLQKEIGEFKKKVELNELSSNTWNATLKTLITDLSQKNEKLSKDAQSLVSALKGESKKQGGWGELVLQRTLEMAGLIEGEEYKMEFSTTNSEGATIRPDAIVFLPDNKHIIIDSKVSLNAYVQYTETDDSEERERHLKNHIISIRTHINSLSEKAYPSGKGLDTPDIVLMFVPVEHGFELAMHQDQQLYEYAYKRNIVIVSSATLLATLKTVASIWKQEKQNKNVQLIAEEAGKMYDKFVGFTETMVKIGTAIDRASTEYDKGISQLKTGKGNLVSRAKKVNSLGAKGASVKRLPTQLENEEDELLE